MEWEVGTPRVELKRRPLCPLTPSSPPVSMPATLVLLGSWPTTTSMGRGPQLVTGLGDSPICMSRDSLYFQSIKMRKIEELHRLGAILVLEVRPQVHSERRE